MSSFVTKILGDKKAWRAMEARAGALPGDYRTVYRQVKSYMWRFTSCDGMATIAILEEVLGLFESGAAHDQNVLDVTGADVAGFCDDRLRGTTYQDRWRESFNRDVASKLAQ